MEHRCPNCKRRLIRTEDDGTIVIAKHAIIIIDGVAMVNCKCGQKVMMPIKLDERPSRVNV